MEMIIPSAGEMDKAAEMLLRRYPGPRVFTLTGDLGAGKTTLVQAYCARLGVHEPVTSPTFALANEYRYCDPETGQEKTVYHLDLYRLHTLEEALDIGILEYLDSGCPCFVEWPQLIEPLLPPDTVRIKLEILPDSSRKILFL